MIFIKILLLIVALIAIISWLADWIVHIKDTRSQKCPVGWGSYKKFIKHFNDYKKWQISNSEGSFFGEGESNNYYIHDNICKFGGKCMKFYPISYLKVIWFCKQVWKEMKGISKPVKW